MHAGCGNRRPGQIIWRAPVVRTEERPSMAIRKESGSLRVVLDLRIEAPLVPTVAGCQADPACSSRWRSRSIIAVSTFSCFAHLRDSMRSGMRPLKGEISCISAQCSCPIWDTQGRYPCDRPAAVCELFHFLARSIELVLRGSIPLFGLSPTPEP